MTCPKCGQTGTIIERMPEGHPHHAKLSCTGPARHYLKWLPKPVAVPERPIWLLGPDARPVSLAEAKKKDGWLHWCREGMEQWQPIATLPAEINGKAKPTK